MPITATCPHCSGSFTAPDSTAGKRFKCPSCKQPMTVPTADEAAAAAAAPAADDGADAGGDDVLDIPSPEEAAAMVSGDDDDDGDDSDDDDSDDDDKKSKKSKREKKPKKEKKKKEKKPKKERADIEMPELDAGAAMGQVMGSLQRALHPSRVLTAAIGMAIILLVSAILTGIGALSGVQILAQLLGLVGSLIVSVGYIIVMVAVAKVDLADLRGEEVPGPIAALKSAITGGIGAVVAAFLIGLLVVAVLLVEGLVGLLAAIPYVGAVFGLPLVIIFFFINLALFAGLPLIQWLIIPLAADGGANPLAPVKGAIARVRREPARLAISFIMFVVFTSLILGVLWLLALAAGAGAAGTVVGMHPLFSGSWMMNQVGMGMVGIFTGGGIAIVIGLVLSPVISAYVCSGCQEIVDNPMDEDDE